MNNSVAVEIPEELAANKVITSEHRVRARRILGAHIYPQYDLYPGLKEHEERIIHHLEQGCAEEFKSDELIAAASVVLAYADRHWAQFVGNRRATKYQLQVLMRASKILITIVARRIVDAQDRRLTIVTPRDVEYAAIAAAHRLVHYRERIERFLTDTWGNSLAHGVR